MTTRLSSPTNIIENKQQDGKAIQQKEKPRRILILGSGFAGIEVLKRLQKEFKNDSSVEIILASKDNFFLFTPMLPEVSVGMIETRDIITPVRTFCKKAIFYQAEINSINFKNKQVIITHYTGNEYNPDKWHSRLLHYDYLVIALGSETNFFGVEELRKYSFTIKTIDDAIILRNHIINMLEQADMEDDSNIHRRELLAKWKQQQRQQENGGNNVSKNRNNDGEGDENPRKSLVTFVVVGGGFSGIETVGAINDFVRETVSEYYKNINIRDVRIVLVDGVDKILAEVDKELGSFALQKLKERGVEFILNTLVSKATQNSVILNNGTIIPTYTIVWTAGVTVSKLIANLECDHDKEGRVLVNSYLELNNYSEVYAVGDCASITNPRTGKSYPPTAQHAIREGKIAADNIITTIRVGRGKGKRTKKNRQRKKKSFDYKTKGMMAEIGKRTGIATLFGLRFKGFMAWWLWRTFYLLQVPTTKKKLKVIIDWSIDALFKPDVAKISRFKSESRYQEDSKTDYTIMKDNGSKTLEKSAVSVDVNENNDPHSEVKSNL